MRRIGGPKETGGGQRQEQKRRQGNQEKTRRGEANQIQEERTQKEQRTADMENCTQQGPRARKVAGGEDTTDQTRARRTRNRPDARRGQRTDGEGDKGIRRAWKPGKEEEKDLGGGQRPGGGDGNNLNNKN